MFGMNVRRNGFTIIEILVVVLILGMLAAFVVPGVIERFGKAKTEIAKAKMNGLITGALEQFALSCGRYPTDDEGLAALIDAPPELEDKWGPRYLKASQILDPWGNPYIYIEQGTINDTYDLICLGADGEDGGEGENADIFND
ncbi:MAG: type II secretion system protein GspG [Planctomycetes bacterium]|nr:type II secretion system protein GspG [Planctomycetota bacterium]